MAPVGEDDRVPIEDAGDDPRLAVVRAAASQREDQEGGEDERTHTHERGTKLGYRQVAVLA